MRRSSQHLPGAERVFEVMDSQPEDEGGSEPFEIENVKGDINFKDIDFSYVKGEQVLKHFDLWVKSGQKIAIVGATGSGKTTVVNLLTRFYDIDGGVITPGRSGYPERPGEEATWKYRHSAPGYRDILGYDRAEYPLRQD